jgi:outer membrane protein OmpA-like peptidoglycan-associated protein/tetratricopeptide (TPR) repeat protein
MYYNQAITYYQLALKKDSENRALKLKLARSYQLVNNYSSSLYWYEQVFSEFPDEGNPIDKYYYGNMLTSAGRYIEAITWYERYQNLEPNDTRPALKITGFEYLSTLYRDSTAIAVEHLPFNTEFDDLAATKYDNGLVFVSSRPSSALVDDDYLREESLMDIYYVSYDEELGWQSVKSFAKEINTSYHEGPLTFDQNKDKLILTRSNLIEGKPNTSTDGKIKLQLITLNKVRDQWQSGSILSFINTEFSYAHPALSVGNDTLYFSSDIEGGYGGNDIYFSVLVGSIWSSPVNLGTTINTEGDEMYPFFADDRLFFSSDGRAGLGGQDIYKAFVKAGKVSRVINIGYPVNSNQDDFAYSIDKTTLSGTFTSNREGGAGLDDLYNYNYLAQVLTGRVVQELDSSLIADALVQLRQQGQLLDSTRTDENGQFNFQLPLNSTFELEVSKDDYATIAPIQISTLENSIDLDSINVSLHKHDLFARGRIINNETQELMEGVRIIIHNTTDNEFDTLITDVLGTYSFVLKPQKDYSIYVGKTGFLLGGVDINTFKISEGVILNDIVLELEYLKKNVVHFEFDKYDLTSNTLSILQRLSRTMRNSTKQLIISAYADARGTVEYNQKLSDKRAIAVSNYLVSLGISESRITARGFGETLMINRCTDGVDCEEIEHSKNRRAEIKIEGSTVR